MRRSALREIYNADVFDKDSTSLHMDLSNSTYVYSNAGYNWGSTTHTTRLPCTVSSPDTNGAWSITGRYLLLPKPPNTNRGIDSQSRTGPHQRRIVLSKQTTNSFCRHPFSLGGSKHKVLEAMDFIFHGVSKGLRWDFVEQRCWGLQERSRFCALD